MLSSFDGKIYSKVPRILPA